MVRHSLVCWTLLSLCAGVGAQNLPTGLWIAYDDSGNKPQAMVRITEQQNRLVGHIVEVLDPAVAPDERCEKCPGGLKDQPLRGLQIIAQVEPTPKGAMWTGGMILDPDDGRQYRLEMEWAPASKELKLRGYWGPFWRTQIWRRPSTGG